MYGEPDLWHALMGRLADDHVDVPAGAGRRGRRGGPALRLLGRRASPRRTTGPSCCRTAAKIFAALAGLGVPRIHFGVGTGELLGLMGEAGADVVGVDWRVPLDEAVRRRGRGQGAAGQPGPGDPARPVGGRGEPGPGGPRPGRTAEGHVFNLGHGVLPGDRPRPAGPAHRPRPRSLSPLSPAVHHRAAGRRRSPRRSRRGWRGGSRRRTGRTASHDQRRPATSHGSSTPSTVRPISIASTKALQPTISPLRKPGPPPAADQLASPRRTG